MFKDFLNFSRFPTTWCSGCGNGIVLKEVAKAFEAMHWTQRNVTVVSGIGCAGRSAGYFNLDTVHSLHGRAVPVAEGIRWANPSLNVVVLSGDGDLLGIGCSHLVHAARRNSHITVVCISNDIYGMTGGQKSPTTGYGVKTITSPEGNLEVPINVQALIKAHGNYYARTTAYHLNHLEKCLLGAMRVRGFSFVEVLTPCMSNFGRRLGFKSLYDMLIHYQKRYTIQDSVPWLKDNEIGITR